MRFNCKCCIITFAILTYPVNGFLNLVTPQQNDDTSSNTVCKYTYCIAVQNDCALHTKYPQLVQSVVRNKRFSSLFSFILS